MTATLTVCLVLAIQTSGLGASAPLLFGEDGGMLGVVCHAHIHSVLCICPDKH